MSETTTAQHKLAQCYGLTDQHSRRNNNICNNNLSIYNMM